MNMQTHLPFDPPSSHGKAHLDLCFTREDDVLVAVLSGQIISTTAGLLIDALANRVVQGARRLLVDLTDVTIATRAGLRGLVVAAKMIQMAGGQMRIVGANGPVLRALQNLALRHVIHLDKDRETARTALDHARARGRGWPAPYSHAELITQPAGSMAVSTAQWEGRDDGL